MDKLINRKVWEAIDNDLGEVTDVTIQFPDEYGYYAIHYKSNGKPQLIQTTASNIKQFIQSFLYTLEFTHSQPAYTALH